MTTNPTPEAVNAVLEESLKLFGPPPGSGDLTLRDKVIAESSYFRGRAEAILEIAKGLYDAANVVEDIVPDAAALYRAQADGLRPLFEKALAGSFDIEGVREEVAETLKATGQ